MDGEPSPFRRLGPDTPVIDDRSGGRILAAAFAQDPMFRHVIPDARQRIRQLPRLFAGSLRHCARRGGVAVVDASGVAGWVDGAHLSVGLVDAARARMLIVPVTIGPAAMGRLNRHERQTEAMIRQTCDGPFAYLWSLGVDPARQGGGLGRRTVTAALAQMRAAGYDRCVLKTEQPDNVGLYRHLGFEVAASGTVESSGLTTWIMIRSTAGAMAPSDP